MVQTNWASLGTLPSEDMFWVPSVVQTIDGRLEVFTLDSQGFFWHIGQTSPNGTWSPWWAEVPHPDFNVSHPYARDLLGIGTNADGRLEVFTLDPQGALWHIGQTSPGAGWSQWSSLGEPSTTQNLAIASVAKNADGRLEVFTLDPQGALWHSWQITPNGTWSPWASLAHPPNFVGSPHPRGLLEIGTNVDGRLEVFTTAQAAIWHSWQTSPGAGWSLWHSLGEPSTTPNLGFASVAKNADGHLEVFGIDSQGAIWHSRQIAPNGTWSPWAPLLGATKSRFLTVEKNADGRLEAFTFTLGSQVALWHSWQLASGGSWSDWAQLDTPTDLSMSWGITTAQNADGRLEIFGIDSQGALWHIWQVTPGNWGSDTAHDQAP